MSSNVEPEGDGRILPPRVRGGFRRIINTVNTAFVGYRRYVLILAALAIVSATLDALGINALIPLISFLSPGASGPTDTISRVMADVFTLVHVPFTFRYLLIFVGLLFLVRSIALAVFSYVRGWVNARFMAREVNSLLSATMHASWSYILRQKAGNLQNTIFWDARREAQLLDGIVQLSQSATGALMYLIVAVNIAPLVTWITFATGVVVIVVFRPLFKKNHGYARQVASMEKFITHHIAESLQGFKQVKAAGAGDRIAEKGSGYIAQLEFALARAFFVQGVGSVFIQPLAFLFVIGIFAFSYFSGTFNLATFAATIYLIQKIFTYVDSTQSSFQTILQFVPFADTIAKFKQEIAENHEKASSGTKPFVFNDALSFRDVNFSYEGKSDMLSGVSFQISKRSFVGIVGPSGSGKTTTADLLLRLFAPSKGDLFLDGVPVGEIDIKEWRRAIAYVSQDAFLINASVADNIRFFDDSISSADVEAAARQAHIYDEAMRLPEGFDTVLGDRGVTLSGGQRQRVALARALARHPQVLVLDEVTSSLDSELEREIQQMIANLRGGITLVVIAHRISTVLDADKLLVLEDGHLIADSAPSAMLADPDSYVARIAALQSAGRNAE